MGEYNCRYPHLFSPIVLADTYFRNRLFASPQGPGYAYALNRPAELTMAFYERRAIGGAASVCIGDTTIDGKRSLANGPHILMDDNGVRPLLSRLTELISRSGAVASVEISHAGGSARTSFLNGEKIYGAIASETNMFGKTTVAYEMPEDMIEEVIEQFGRAAEFAKLCGFGMITIHGGHGWLLNQFMSLTNNRKDQWGGSFENRMRFPLAVVQRVRRAVGPKFPIEIRLSGSECYDGGYDVAYGARIAEALDGKVDLLHISVGSHEKEEVFTVTHPSMFLEDGVNVKYAAEIKKHVKTPVATVGALDDPEMMEEIIASGKADVVEVARGLMADPDLPNKARSGREANIRPCLRCFTCFSNQITNGNILCAVNPEIGNELDAKYEKTPAVSKKVLVAGGGIGGMEAAIECAKRGHRVILCEKSGRLGGVLRCEEKVPFKAHLSEYLDLQERLITENDAIELRLNTEVTPELAKKLGPDVIVAALGARPFVPAIPGTDGANVIAAEELYMAPEKAGKRVAILGGGLVGTEMAIFMSSLGHECIIIEMENRLNFGKNNLHAMAVRGELKKYGVDIRLGARAAGITEKGVKAATEGGEIFIEADTVVTALGMKPLREETSALALCAPEFYALGDCVTPKTIKEATEKAYQLAINISRA